MSTSWRWPLAGFVVGSLIGATVLTVNAVGAFVGGETATPAHAGISFGEILHTPPSLTPVGRPVELVYDLVCPPDDADAPPAPCSPSGTLHVRAAGEQEFGSLRLTMDGDGRLSATVPGSYAAGPGFDYYVDVEEGRGGAGSLPAGGPDSPQHVWTVSSEAVVELGTHDFGHVREPDEVVVRAAWGRDQGEVGLIRGREQATIGPSAFDVGSDGTVVVLDQVNRRLVFSGAGTTPRELPIPFSGGEGDVASDDRGTYVLDDGGAEEPAPFVRSFDGSGRLVSTTALAEPVADMLRVGPQGPVVHTYPSELWYPTGGGTPPLTPVEQTASGEAARRTEEGLGVVVQGRPDEARFALVRDEQVAQSWLVKSATRIGEVQLAEPYGEGMLVVLRLWTEDEAEFEVLRLGPGGLADAFAVERAEWAESASLSRFRLCGSKLYQLRSDPNGIEVAAYTIGGKR